MFYTTQWTKIDHYYYKLFADRYLTTYGQNNGKSFSPYKPDVVTNNDFQKCIFCVCQHDAIIDCLFSTLVGAQIVNRVIIYLHASTHSFIVCPQKIKRVQFWNTKPQFLKRIIIWESDNSRNMLINQFNSAIFHMGNFSIEM